MKAKQILTSLYFILIGISLQSQQICNYQTLYPYWTDYCPDAYPVCDLNELNATTCTFAPFVPYHNGCFDWTVCWGGSWEVPNYFAFHGPSGPFQIDVVSDEVTIVAVYDGCHCEGGQCVASSSPGTSHSFALDLTKNHIYNMVVVGAWNTPLTFYTVSVTPPAGYDPNFIECPDFQLQTCQDDIGDAIYSGKLVLPEQGSLDVLTVVSTTENVKIDLSVNSPSGGALPFVGTQTFMQSENNFTFSEVGIYEICLESVYTDCAIASCNFPICETIEIVSCPSEYIFTSESICFSEFENQGYFPVDNQNQLMWPGGFLDVDDVDDSGCVTFESTYLCGCNPNMIVCPDFISNTQEENFIVYLQEFDTYCPSPANCYEQSSEGLKIFIPSLDPGACDLYVELNFYDFSLDMNIDTLENNCNQIHLKAEVLGSEPSVDEDDVKFAWINSQGDTLSTLDNFILDVNEAYTLHYSFETLNEQGYVFLFEESIPFDFSEECSTCEPIILLDVAGESVTDANGPIVHQYGTDISSCSTIKFSVDYSFNQAWEGTGNMEICDEECIPGNTCNCDPSQSTTGGCDNCWDFMWVQFMIDGQEVGGDLIGDVGTTDDEQMGVIEHILCTDQADQAEIIITNQNWAANETNTFSNVTIVCYETDLPQIEDKNVCEFGELSLNVPHQNYGCLTDWLWTSQEGSGIEEPNKSHTFLYNGLDGDIITLTVTDINGCTFSESFTLSVVNCDDCFCEDLVDENINCTTEWNPVCGCNGTTYANACVAEYEKGAISWTQGQCHGLVVDTVYASNISECDVVLEQVVLSFTAVAEYDHVSLDWEISKGESFEVLRSQDGLQFTKLKELKARAGINLSYNYQDFSPHQGSNYYKIIIHGLDQEVKHSHIKHVDFEKEQLKGSITPQPVIDILYFNHDNLKEGQVKIFDLNGKLIATKGSNKSDQQIRFRNLDYLETGVYLLLYEHDGNMEVYRFFKS